MCTPFVSFIVWLALGSPKQYMSWFIFAQFLYWLWIFPLRRANRRGLAHLRECECLVCPACRYDLRGNASPCPECGRAFDAAGLRAEWSDAYRHHLRMTGFAGFGAWRDDLDPPTSR